MTQPATRLERFYEWLGLTPRRHHQALLYKADDLHNQLVEERRRIRRLWFALAELTGTVDQKTRDRLNNRLRLPGGDGQPPRIPLR